MISDKIVDLLNNQIKLESFASMEYVAMATWAEANKFNGIATFFYSQAEEERMHMIKLIKFVSERGVRPKTPVVDEFKTEFKDLKDLFDTFLKSEKKVTEHINQIVSQCLAEKDYITHHFMQWYVSEQMEEEHLAQSIIDKFDIIDDDKGGLYLFDRDLGELNITSTNKIK